MTKTIATMLARLCHRSLVTALLLSWLLGGYLQATGTPVILMPVPKPQFFDNSGRPLSFGCIFTYAINTTTPLATYTDNTGTVANTNPVILTAGGFTASAGNGIWLQAGLAYTLVVKAAGGTNCASGATQYTVNGIGGGATTLTTNVTYSTTPVFTIQAQNQLFVITLTGDASSQPLTAVGIVPPGLVTWEIIQDNVGGHVFTWPANSVGGCTIGATANQTTLQHFIWDGTTAIAVGPCVIGNGPEIDSGTIHVTGDVNATGDVLAAHFKSQCANLASVGTIRLCKTDSINWRNDGNLADQGISQDTSNRGIWSFAGGFETTGIIPDIFLGGTTSSFPRLKRNGTAVNFRLGDDSGDAPITASTGGFSDVITSSSTTYDVLGNEVSTPGSPPASGKQQLYPKASHGYCSQDSASAEYCPIKGANGFGLIQKVRSTSNCTTGSTGHDSCNDTFTWPVTFGDTNYTVVCSGADSSIGSAGETAILNVFSYTATQVVVVTQTEHDTRTAHYQTIGCIAIHD